LHEAGHLLPGFVQIEFSAMLCERCVFAVTSYRGS